jgi:hypothetical protein
MADAETTWANISASTLSGLWPGSRS